MICKSGGGAKTKKLKRKSRKLERQELAFLASEKEHFANFLYKNILWFLSRLVNE